MNLSIKTIRSITDANIVDLKDNFQSASIQNIVIDTRSPAIGCNSLFVILEGNKSSGADFIDEFCDKGGRFILTDKRLEHPDLIQIVVENSLIALQKIAIHHREKFQIPVIGITGSNGKTTVKEWLYHVLKDKFQIVRSPKSYNSQIGVALSVLEMDEKDELAIFEAGISIPGEMEALEKMIQPTIGAFTGIGDAHNSGFAEVSNPIELKLSEKYLLFRNVNLLIERKGDIFQLTKKDNCEVINLLLNDNTVQLKSQNRDEMIFLPYGGKGTVSNSVLVYLTALELGLDHGFIQKRLSNLPSISMRLEKMTGKFNNLLINDAYNVDAKSLEIAVQFLDANSEGKERAIFLAENPEKTNTSNSLLHILKDYLLQIKIHKVIYFGPKEIAERFNFIDQQYDTVNQFSDVPYSIENTAILFAGARSCHLETVVNSFSEKKHITRLIVDLAAMRHNLNLYRRRLSSTTKILAMVKAQSYGGGILEVAKFLASENVDYFGVAYADEGVTLRKGGITLPIIVMNPEPAAFEDMVAYNLEPSIYSLELLNGFIHQLILLQRTNYPIHIKLDTGMNRLGFRTADLKVLMETINTQPEVFIKSVFSHLAVADENDTESVAYIQNQLKHFNEGVFIIEDNLDYTFIKHISNSAGALAYPSSHLNMVRLGIGLFGLLDKSIESGLENVLKLQSQVSQIRSIKAGESVGYGLKYTAKNDTQIGVVPVGYSDGLRRGLSGQNWKVQIGEELFEIVGNICMDMCMIDLRNSNVQVGDEVLLFGGDENTIFEMSERLKTIPYEVISGISSRVQRVYIEE